MTPPRVCGCVLVPPSRPRTDAAVVPFVAFVEDDEVTDQVEQAGFLAHLGQRPVQQSASGERGGARRLPFHEELLLRRYRAVPKSL